MIIPNFGSLYYYTYDLISIHAQRIVCAQKPQVCDCYKCLIGEEETFLKRYFAHKNEEYDVNECKRYHMTTGL